MFEARSSVRAGAAILIAALAVLGGALVAAQGTGPRRVEVLVFAEPSQGHDTARFAPVLKAALSQYGFNFSYTTTSKDFTASNLAQYDAVVLAGGETPLSAQEEAALVDFVSLGRGLVAVDAAGVAFGRSARYVALLGGLIEHGSAGQVAPSLTATATSHPITAGFVPFATDAAVTVSRENSNGRTVLLESGSGTTGQPWTWVRSEGQGRVFYTAYGHDEKTWTRPEFQLLMKNALVWAIGPRVAGQLAALRILPLEYSDGIVPIPNYERREPAPKLQAPLSPAEAAKHVQLPPGFELQLFASEPLVTGNPIALAWDERGRLWLAETRDYPNNLQTNGQGNDVIKILEDTNRDGRADKATVFADKLTIVTSLVFSEGGVIVAQADRLIRLKDTNGDDRADTRETVMTGFGTRDTHALASNLRYGLDNWIWGTVGYSGFNGTVAGKTFTFNQALFRLTPDAAALEHMATFTNNTWGLGFNETGDVFGSTANGEHSNYVAIPRPFYDKVKGLSGDGKKKIDGHYALQPNTTKIRQVDVQGGFTAAAGHTFYTARSFPQEYWNRVAFVSEPTGHVLHRAVIERRGSGFAESDGWNVAASDDEWFAPVASEVGPDGALWLLDFYDFIIQHNPTPFGPIVQGYTYLNGRGNAYETPLRERSRGRVYRLVWKGAKPAAPLSLSASRPAELVAALRHDNMFWRLTAQRLLVERRQTDVVPAIIALVDDRNVDAVGLNGAAVHALWTLHGLGVLDGRDPTALAAVRRALTHPAAGVRKAAQSVLPKTSESLAALVTAGALEDADLNVRLNALLMVSSMPASTEAGRALYALSKRPEVVADEWLPEALWIAATTHQDGFLQSYAAEIGLTEFMRVGVKGARGDVPGSADWSSPTLDEAGWLTIPAPRVWAETAIGDLVGTVWFRRTFEVPASAAGAPALIRLGIVDDTDVTYINGRRLNSTVNQRNAPRQYEIPAGMLVAGTNTIAVRISNVNGRGGFAPDPAPVSGVAPLAPAAGQPTLTGMMIAGNGFSIPLNGDWKAKIEERWEGARRREIATTTPIAEQFLMANSPVADLLRTPAPLTGTGAPMTAGDIGAARLALGVVPGQMKFDTALFTVRAGQRVALTLSNPDTMQHNVVIFKRGSMDQYEKELFGSMNEPNAQLRGFVPDSPNVLFATRLLNAGESTTLTFDAPTEPGDYPFVCTFPGHWVLMRGILRVQ
jgi:uncharacterized protein